MKIILMLLCFVCFNSVLSELNKYKAGVASRTQFNQLRKNSLALETDVLVLQPFEELTELDKTVKAISAAARQGRTYVVAHLLERVKCQNGAGLVGNNFVFDRNGDVVTVSRNLKDTSLNCNLTSSGTNSFTTDFGVTFGLLTLDNMILQNTKNFDNLKNFVIPEKLTLDIPFFSDLQFLQSWAYVRSANLVTSAGVLAGERGVMSHTGDPIHIVDLAATSPGSEFLLTSTLKTAEEDLSKYKTTLINTETTTTGLKERLCHDSFCCEFYIKSSYGSESVDLNLGVYDGVTVYGDRNIGVQNCAVLPKHGSAVNLERVTISANFTNGDPQYPIVSSSQQIESNSLRFDTKLISDAQTATFEITNAKGVVNIGIFGRNLSKDNVYKMAIYDYIFNDNVIEFFDYVWIRLRVLILVVSIYVLEML